MCKLCETKPVYEFTNKRKVCKNCFVKYFQKKFLFIIRKFKMIPRESVIGYENKGDFCGVVLENLLEMFAEKGHIEVIKLPSKKKIDKIALPLTTDSEADKIIQILVKGNVRDLKEVAPVDKKTIKPLYLFLDAEVLLYAKIKKLKFKEVKEKKDNLSVFIDDLEKKHPEIKRAIIQSYLSLE